MATEFGTDDEVGDDPDPCAKFLLRSDNGFSLQLPPILRTGGKYTVRENVPFEGNLKQNFTFRPHVLSKTQFFGQFLTGLITEFI